MSCDIDDPDLPLADLFRAWPMLARVFLRHRTACFGCPIAPFHTIVDTCAEYRLDEAAFRAELRAELRAALQAEREAATSPPRSGQRGGAGQ